MGDREAREWFASAHSVAAPSVSIFRSCFVFHHIYVHPARFGHFLIQNVLETPRFCVRGVCCAEMTAGVTFERRWGLNVENQLLVAAPCTFLALRFPMNLALLMPSALKAGPHTLPIQRYKINVFVHF